MTSLARRTSRRLRHVAGTAPGTDVLRRRRAIEVLRSSGLFDADWYREQLPPEEPAGGDLVEHYVRVGAGLGLSPHPAFEPGWYVSKHRDAKRTPYDPFTHFLLKGAARGDDPHPTFDAGWYSQQVKAARSHPRGPLGHYLERGWREGREPNPTFDSATYRRIHPEVTGPPFLDFARRTGRLLRSTRGYGHLPRMVDHFDVAAAEEFKRSVRAAYAARGGPDPLVSVIMPTKDRAAEVVVAARSVLAQTYPHFELVVVDDGSTDGTAEALAEVRADPRVRYVRRDTAGGVATARNAGLAQARGDYVAYLDSDNTWKPDFLEIMVGFVTTRGLRAAYCVSELLGAEHHEFRAMPFHYEALRERNYIDCIVVLHERSLLAEVGGFDESLRRMVDWDLLIRIGGRTRMELAPFIGTTYDLWEERDDRITNKEPWGYRFVIKSKHLLDWEAARRDVARRAPDLVSVLLHSRGDLALLERSVARLCESAAPGRLEVVVVDSASGAGAFFRLQQLGYRYPDVVRVVRTAHELTFEAATNFAAVSARGAVLVLMGGNVLVEPGWLDPLVEPLRSGRAVATQPLLLGPEGTVFSAGVAFSRLGRPHEVLAGFPGDAPEVAAASGPRSALSGTCLAVRAEDFLAVRGSDAFYMNVPDNPDLSLRLAEASGRPLEVVTASVAVRAGTRASGDQRATVTDLDNRRHFARRWSPRVPADLEPTLAATGHSVVRYDRVVERGVPPELVRFQPLVVRDRPSRPTRWAIKIGMLNVVDRQGWGDWYFAGALKEALQRRGHEAVVDPVLAWYRPTTHLDDVVLVLRGKERYVPNPQHRNLLWVISHPDDVDASEIAAYDRVFAASAAYAERFRSAHPRGVEALLQCTDPERFRPVPPDPVRRHEVLFVGNSRGVLRPIVRDALDAGLDLSVYGAGWRRFLGDGVVRGEYVPNAVLPATYCAAGVVLNDHWEDMRVGGFLSNRLFDLTACGARVVSDEAAGLHELFGELVATYTTPDELASAVKEQLREDEAQAQARRAFSEVVRREHSFAARAARLVAAADALAGELTAAASPGAGREA